MQAPFEVKRLDLSDAALAARVLSLQLAAHRLEAEWLSYPHLPVLWTDLAAAQACVDAVWGAFEGESLRGVLVASRREDGGLHIERVVVDPQQLRAGWGYRLLNRALVGESEVSVDTAEVNIAALSLYRKAGFVAEQRWSTPDGLMLWRLNYQPAPPPAFQLLEDGWLDGARWIPSPNHDERGEDMAPELLVIHNISLPPYRYGGLGVEQLFQNRLNPDEHPFYAEIQHLRVSSHFFIRRSGELQQFVPVTRRAWHAGVSNWRGRERCNDFSIGVELEGCDFEPFSEAQYRTLKALALALRRRLPLSAIIGHEHIAPGRKTDPGPFFDWPRAEADSGLSR